MTPAEKAQRASDRNNAEHPLSVGASSLTKRLHGETLLRLRVQFREDLAESYLRGPMKTAEKIIWVEAWVSASDKGYYAVQETYVSRIALIEKVNQFTGYPTA